MHVPSPLSGPWSPVGYTVVPLAVESAPPSPAPPAPRSPIGYQVVVVADEQVPVRLKEHRPRQRRWGRPKGSSLAIWLPIVGFGLLILLPVLAFSWVTLSVAPPAQGQVAIIPDDLGVPVKGVAEVQLPVELHEAQAPAAPLAQEPALAPEEPRPKEEALAVRDNFGTAVEFARNAQDAARIAKEQDKLTMFLHVSGNFEDNKFT